MNVKSRSATLLVMGLAITTAPKPGHCQAGWRITTLPAAKASQLGFGWGSLTTSTMSYEGASGVSGGSAAFMATAAGGFGSFLNVPSSNGLGSTSSVATDIHAEVDSATTATYYNAQNVPAIPPVGSSVSIEEDGIDEQMALAANLPAPVSGANSSAGINASSALILGGWYELMTGHYFPVGYIPANWGQYLGAALPANGSYPGEGYIGNVPGAPQNVPGPSN